VAENVGSYHTQYPNAELEICFSEQGLWFDKNDGWWFSTEDEDLIGPYSTKLIAAKSAVEYYEYVPNDG
jgi:hypothetical protein